MKMLGLKLIVVFLLTGSISPKTYNILHKRNVEDSNDDMRVLLDESDREVLEVPLLEYEDDNKPSKNDNSTLMIKYSKSLPKDAALLQKFKFI